MWLWKRKIRFAEFAAIVLEAKKLKSRNTYLSAKIQIRRLVNHFGEFPLSKIDETAWLKYITLERQRKDRKFFDDRKYMRSILLQAQREGHIQKSIRLPIPDPPWNVGREITCEELRKLNLQASSELAFQIEVAWKTGLRLREMLHLRWNQFDWERQVIILLPSDTKTRRGRTVPINEDLFEKFRKLKNEIDSPFVFPSPRNKNRPQDNNKTAWRRCKRKAGVHARWHDLRHRSATQMLRRGVTVEVASLYLGMSPKILRKIYLHLNIEDLKNAAALMRHG